MLYNLANNQRVQGKLRDEIMTVLPKVDSPLTSECLKNVSYLRACIKESMRITPVSFGVQRAAGRDIVLQGYQLPKGVNLSN